MTLHNPLALPVNGKISEPGCYAIPIEAYHSDICVGPSVSSSGLRTIWAESPAHFWVRSALNPKRLPQDDRPAFAVGRLAHKLLLEGREGLEQDFAIRPDEWTDWRTKDAKAWRELQIEMGRTVITPDDLVTVTGMAESLARHPVVKAGILDGHVERSLIWKDAETGIWLKSRPDVIPNSSGDYADLKTTVSVSTKALEQSLASFDYAMQGALVGMASEAVLGIPMQSFTLVWVEKTAPFCVRVTTLTPDDLERGRMQVRAALKSMARCLDTGEWPGPGAQHDAEYISLPPYAAKRIDDELEIIAASANDNARTEEAA